MADVKLPYDVLRPEELRINLAQLRDGFGREADYAAGRIIESHETLVAKYAELWQHCEGVVEELHAMEDLPHCDAEFRLARVRELADMELAIGMTRSPVSPQQFGRCVLAQRIISVLG